MSNEAYSKGYREGYNNGYGVGDNKNAKGNPYQYGTEAHDQWESGCEDGECDGSHDKMERFV